MKIAVLGCGYWGKNHVRTFHKLGVLAAVCDPTPAGKAKAEELAPGVPIYDSMESMLDTTKVDGIVIATPAETHADLAELALHSDLDVLVEKPIALRVEDARHLHELALERGRILMVGHVLMYHPALEKMSDLVHSGELGTIRYIYSNRLNHGKIRREENILWSFAPHDISLVLGLTGSMPIEVVATGGNYITPNIADTTVTQLLFDNGIRSHIFVSWLHPYKEQKLVVVGSKKMAVYDDVNKELAVFDQSVEWENGHPQAVQGEKHVVEFGSEEPLRREAEEFLEAIKTRQPPISDGKNALEVLMVLSAAQRSLMTHGMPVQLPFAASFNSSRHGSSPLDTRLTPTNVSKED